MKKSVIIGVGLAVAALISYWIFGGATDEKMTDIIVKVEFGDFQQIIETSGELEAKNSVKIKAPSGLRNYRIYNVTIQDIVEEGETVKKGDWIAGLDRSEFKTKVQDKQIELEKAQSKYVQTQLDTTLQMRQSRDELVNLEYSVQEKKIVLDQSKFEPPATIKQAEIDLDKARRALTQAEENYKIKFRQNVAKMQEVNAELRKVKGEYSGMEKLSNSFTILAPEDGMVIYTKDWDGKPVKAGSQISTWDPTVATLPDLSRMVSKTYVNEVDVRKIKSGQLVDIGLDAFPEKKLFGKVIKVANVGEQRPNSDAKVFQVNVEIEGYDELLRPAMTTSNKILTKEIEGVLSVPLETLHSKNDSITFVYIKDGGGISKQEVLVGETNADMAIILKGLSQEDKLYLSTPNNMESDEILLLSELSGKRNQEKKEGSEKQAAYSRRSK